MALFWSEYLYGTGVPELDEQHRKLFDQVNQLVEASKRGGDPEEVKAIMGFLSDYVVSHFKCEEELMESRCCSACPDNKAAHCEFLKEFTALKKRFESEGATANFTIDLQRKVCDWLANHVGKIDTKLQDTVPV